METAQLIFNLLATLGTVAAAWFAYQSARSAQLSNEANFMPILEPSLKHVDEDSFTIEIVNIGREVARDVDVTLRNVTLESSHASIIKVGHMHKAYVLEYDPKTISTDLMIEYYDIFHTKIITRGTLVLRKDNSRVDHVVWQVDSVN